MNKTNDVTLSHAIAGQFVRFVQTIDIAIAYKLSVDALKVCALPLVRQAGRVSVRDGV